MLARLLLLVSGVLVGLLLGEVLCRATLCHNTDGQFWEPNRLYGWAHIPGGRGWAQRCLGGKPEWRAYTRINGLGLRDREIPYARQGGFRILVLGDSFTEGIQVDQDKTFAKLLERQLNAEAGSQVFEVLNGGVAGWGTDNSLLFFRHEGWKYRPDLVVLAFNTANDIMENHHALMRGTGFPYPEKPSFALEESRLVLRSFPLPARSVLARLGFRVQQSLFRHSALYRFLDQLSLRIPRLAAAAPPPPPRPTSAWDVYVKDYPPAWREAWRITRGLVLELRRTVEARGSRFAVLVLNSRGEVTTDTKKAWGAPDKPNRLIVDFLTRRGIFAIPLLEPFRAHYRETGVTGYFGWDVHWAPAGHELAARVLAARLRELNLLDSDPRLRLGSESANERVALSGSGEGRAAGGEAAAAQRGAPEELGELTRAASPTRVSAVACPP